MELWKNKAQCDLRALAQANAVSGTALPLCPDSLLVAENAIRQDPMRAADERGLEDWATFGAINAGIVPVHRADRQGRN